MEKVLNVLKDLCLVINFNSYWKPRVEEAIAELEKAMEPKTCGECVAYDKDGNCKENVRISNVQGVPSSFYCKWHELKDT